LLSGFNYDRVLALSATPGSDTKSIQSVISNLLISHMEIRSDSDLDVRPYVHTTTVDAITIPLSASLVEVRTLFLEIFRIPIEKLVHMKAFYSSDVERVSHFQLLQQRNKIRENPPRDIDTSQMFLVEGLFGVAMALAQAWKLLNSHGLQPFKSSLMELERDAMVNNRKMRHEFIKSSQHWPSLMTLLEQSTGKVTQLLWLPLIFRVTIILNWLKWKSCYYSISVLEQTQRALVP
jgi:ERCC4-related helicase